MNYGGQTNYREYSPRDQTSFQQKEKKSIDLDEPISGKKIIFVIGFFLISFKCINYYLNLERYLEERYQEQLADFFVIHNIYGTSYPEIEKDLNNVHKFYTKQENISSRFQVEQVRG